MTGDRPTSGKHWARAHQYGKRKGTLQQPNQDPLTSGVAKNFEKSKKVESLLNKLAGYMAGDIPDLDDLGDAFPDEPEDKEKEAVPSEINQPDDATTVATHGPFFPGGTANRFNGPREIIADPDDENVEIEGDEPVQEDDDEGDEDDDGLDLD